MPFGAPFNLPRYANYDNVEEESEQERKEIYDFLEIRRSILQNSLQRRFRGHVFDLRYPFQCVVRGKEGRERTLMYHVTYQNAVFDMGALGRGRFDQYRIVAVVLEDQVRLQHEEPTMMNELCDGLVVQHQQPGDWKTVRFVIHHTFREPYKMLDPLPNCFWIVYDEVERRRPVKLTDFYYEFFTITRYTIQYFRNDRQHLLLALCMGTHKRLGENSFLKDLLWPSAGVGNDICTVFKSIVLEKEAQAAEAAAAEAALAAELAGEAWAGDASDNDWVAPNDWVTFGPDTAGAAEMGEAQADATQAQAEDTAGAAEMGEAQAEEKTGPKVYDPERPAYLWFIAKYVDEGIQERYDEEERHSKMLLDDWARRKAEAERVDLTVESPAEGVCGGSQPMLVVDFEEEL